jgi:hypothetical protein
MSISRGDKMLRVFVSSTSEDLKEYRGVARLVILDMGWHPEMMEHFEANPNPTVEACYEDLKRCQLMILIVAFRRGWVPSRVQGGDGQKSITALELEYARKNKIDVLAFRANDDWPGRLWEREPTASEWIEKFRKDLNLVAPEFGYEEHPTKEAVFGTNLKRALVSYHQMRLERSIDSSVSDMENFDGASARMRSGRCIPFLGHGVYGKGPLSICALRQALEDNACKSCEKPGDACERSSPATFAEYLERSKARDVFLDNLKKAITYQQEQLRKAALPPLYALLQKLKPPLIVSATEDLLLEEELSSVGKGCLILCHAIRSQHGNEHDGKVLVFNGSEDNDPKVCPADKIYLGNEHEKESSGKPYIVYKPLGSPLLHSKLDFDTVVMTEADYGLLLRRLGNIETGMPGILPTLFQANPPIFLGYPMDVWHYRLLGQVFQSIGLTGSRLKPYFAVRKAVDRMEELAWGSLEVKLLPMDPNAFAIQVEATL